MAALSIVVRVDKKKHPLITNKVGKCVILCQIVENPSPISQLTGEFEATVDAKSRFLLPAGLKKQLPEGERVFVINRGFDKCLSLYPLYSWNPIIEQIAAKSDFDANVRNFRRAFMAGATHVELDSAGRLLLPPSLKEWAGIGKDIILNGALNKVEIWDVRKYKEFFDDMSTDDFSNLADVVMGGSNDLKL
ncbi:division/cell wall cluster transcriptional repressor MraZ [Aridibaculum aurantiacum]|uniref:division/cell wall cluster transcriptional repressor MraZ n=1 Tax=Aridibaculum aurantiacum TaxID=2810307 RepID=UPI001F6055FD|nr:division/cell wall cluster transcriptional repressor MraZ [Aridibaculum aurantiacum]